MIKSGRVLSPLVLQLMTLTEYPKTINKMIKVIKLKIMVEIPSFKLYNGRIVDKFIKIIKTHNIKNFRVLLIGYFMISPKFTLIT